MTRSLKIERAVSEVLSRSEMNGVYRLSKSIGGLFPVLDGRSLGDKHALLRAFGQALDFPVYYGANWDALEECLSDLSWHSGPICLLIDHAESIPESLMKTLLEIFSYAAEHWAAEGRVCSLFLNGLEKAEIPLLA
jgi:RNAse (barnase) inhibitor barstar